MKTLPLKTLLLSLLAAAVLAGCGGSEQTLQEFVLEQNQQQQNQQPDGPAPVLSFRVVNTFPHDTDAFTQGLVYQSGLLYESTGLVDQSSLREVQLVTGDVIRQENIDDVFCEGLAFRQGILYQLTLNSGQAFLWNQNSFTVSSTVSVPVPAWGLALTDEDLFVFSDGTSTLRFLNPADLTEVRRVTVTDDGQEVDLLNELEFINGLVYANRFTTDEIVAIDPDTGEVAFRVDLTGIIDKQANNLGSNDVLNGIAFDAVQGRLFVTGKRWPFLYQIELVQ